MTFQLPYAALAIGIMESVAKCVMITYQNKEDKTNALLTVYFIRGGMLMILHYQQAVELQLKTMWA